MICSSFCCILSLQVGVSVLAGVFLTLASVILIVNLFYFINGTGVESSKNVTTEDSKGDSWATDTLLIIIIFVILLAAAGIFAFFSSYNESRPMALLALLLIIVIMIYWLVLCIYSFYNSKEENVDVCISHHCPETFWLANLDYKNKSSSSNDTSAAKTSLNLEKIRRWSDKGEEKYNTEVPTIFEEKEKYSIPFDNIRWSKSLMLKRDNNKNLTENSNSNPNRPYFKNSPHYSQFTHINSSFIQGHSFDFLTNKNKTEKGKDSKTVEDKESGHGPGLIMAIFLFFLNLAFLVYSALILWSWADEIRWADYYIEDETIWYY